MARDMFMHVDSAKGESTDSAFKDEIEILSFSHNLKQAGSATASTAGGGTTGRINFGDFTVVKELDLASPLLFKLCASGKNISSIWVKLRRAAGDQQMVFYEYQFTNCTITSINQSGEYRSEGTVPTETLTFNFGSMKSTYTRQDRTTGAGSGSVDGGWDLRANKLM